MLTRRDGILAALCGMMSKAVPADAQIVPLTSAALTLPQKWRFSLDLDGMAGLDVISGGKTIHVSPAEIFAALKQSK